MPLALLGARLSEHPELTLTIFSHSSMLLQALQLLHGSLDRPSITSLRVFAYNLLFSWNAFPQTRAWLTLFKYHLIREKPSLTTLYKMATPWLHFALLCIYFLIPILLDILHLYLARLGFFIYNLLMSPIRMKALIAKILFCSLLDPQNLEWSLEFFKFYLFYLFNGIRTSWKFTNKSRYE